MVYHLVNMVFLGISIEGVAFRRPIEVLEKRGLLSQARWAGGAIAGAINPAPLFSLNFNSTELWSGCKLVPSQACVSKIF